MAIDTNQLKAALKKSREKREQQQHSNKISYDISSPANRPQMLR
jgi:hypothetical protein